MEQLIHELQQRLLLLEQRAPRHLPTLRYSSENEDWAVFRANFEQIRAFYGYPNEAACRALASCMRKDAARAIADIPVVSADPDNPILISTLLDEYEQRFLPAASSAAAQSKYEISRMLSNETILAWHGRVRDLFGRAYPGQEPQTSRNLIRRFALGIKHQSVKNHVLINNPTLFHEALTLAQNAYSVLESGAILTHGPVTRAAPVARSQEEPMEIGAISDPCYKCGKFGHWAKFCRGGSSQSASRGNSSSSSKGRGNYRPSSNYRPPSNFSNSGNKGRRPFNKGGQRGFTTKRLYEMADEEENEGENPPSEWDTEEPSQEDFP